MTFSNNSFMVATYVPRRYESPAWRDASSVGRGLLLAGLVLLTGCLPERRAHEIWAPPAADSVSEGGTAAAAVVESAPPASVVKVVPAPGPVDAPPRTVQPRVPRMRPAFGEVAEPPRAIAQLAPRYPAALRDSGIDGQVMASFVVDIAGRAREVEAQASHAAFAQAVREVLPHWRFEPARDAAGRPVAARVRQVFRFRIED